MAATAEPRRMNLQEVKNWLDSKGPLLFIDARSEDDYRTSDSKIPGAHRVPPDDYEAHRGSIPQEARQIAVVYCSCPDEASSVAVASRMQRDGWANAQPLAGGFGGWISSGMPVEPK